ncbi:YdaS family helix-turn-helix protein [Methylovorus glucosotrophus]|nr:YdaS family helix-turn-helix protein [Methylovorus glucosotrophus]
MDKHQKNVVDQVISLIEGGRPALAAALDISEQAIHKWVKSGRIPTERVRDVEELINFQITRYEMRPDIYGTQPENKAA